MKINKGLLPLKIHYFFFLGCMSPIIPFIIVLASQLGIPVSVQGTINATILLMTVFAKPIIAAGADTFPNYRKAIFLVMLTFTISCYTSLWFIPPLRQRPVIEGQLVRAIPSKILVSDGEVLEEDHDFTSQPLLLTHNAGSCYLAVAWDCLASCNRPWKCLSGNSTQADFKVQKILDSHTLEIATDPSDILPSENELAFESNSSRPSWNISGEDIATGHLYQLEGVNISWDLMGQNISLVCGFAEWTGERCQSAWHYWEFWVYVLLLLVGQISFASAVSITDAIAVDSTRDNQGRYGYQRAWGTVGWGLMGPISGLLVDLWSGDSAFKDYTPSFMLIFIMGSIDLVTCASSVKVPKIGGDSQNVLKDLGPLLRQPRFIIFCCFVIVNGLFDGVVAQFIFLLQEQMAQGTAAMRYMKFLQGFTIFVQCSLEAPFMFVYGWFLRKLGAQRVTSLVFFLYIFRLLGLSLVGFYGPVWATLLTELLNGPCYGLGYTAIVVYAAKISPPGTSTTVQSIVNICYESFGYALAFMLGGILFEALGGPKMYMLMGIASIVTFVLHFFSLKFLPPPEEFVHVNGVVADPSRQSAGAGDTREDREEDEEQEALALNLNGESNSNHRGSIDSADTVTESTVITPMEEKY